MKLVSLFIERYAEWLKALTEHLQLTLLASLIAIFIAVPIGMILVRHRRLSAFVLQIAGIFQTLPSLALLGLFIPFMGIGTVPAVVALVIYAVFPILQNTIVGLTGIDESLVEAATAFGMTRWERLKTFELALAMPTIMSGIRTAVVMIIGAATLAALIGAGGLGSFILLGIDRNNQQLILLGAISSALLAIVFNFALKIVENKKPKTLLFVLLSVLSGTVLSYTPPHLVNQQQRTIVVAGKLGVEPDILINMYKVLIEENSNLKVALKSNFGKTSFLYEALKKGDIDIYPEFTGTIVSSLLQKNVEIPRSERAVYELARDELKKQDNLALLEPMLYQNTYALAVSEQFAAQYQLKNISDLLAIQGQLKAGFTLEFNDRQDGYKGLQDLYGLNLAVATMEPALRYQAIRTGDVQVIDAYSTDAELIRYRLVTLKDDKQLFPIYQGAPLMREDLLKEYPELKGILNKLAGQISDEEMAQLNYQVSVEGKSAQEVAKKFLKTKGIN